MSICALFNGLLDINVKKITTNEVLSNGGNIIIDGTTTFSSNNHIGQTMIPSLGTTSAAIPIPNMNNDAVILITARNSIDSLWVVPITGSFTVQTATPAGADIYVDYFVLKAD